jgi:hypothetical protein
MKTSSSTKFWSWALKSAQRHKKDQVEIPFTHDMVKKYKHFLFAKEGLEWFDKRAKETPMDIWMKGQFFHKEMDNDALDHGFDVEIDVNKEGYRVFRFYLWELSLKPSKT